MSKICSKQKKYEMNYHWYNIRLFFQIMELALNKAGLNSEKQRKFRLKKSDFVFSLKYVW